MDFPKCATCPHWQRREDVKVTLNVSGVIATGAPDPRQIVVGECTGQPPQTLIVPIQSLQGPGLAPQPFERMTQADRPGCSLHPDTPANVLAREYMLRSLKYMDDSDADRARAMHLAEQSEARAKQWAADVEANEKAVRVLLGERGSGQG